MSKPYLQMGPWSIWGELTLMIRPLTWFRTAPWSDGDGFGWVRWLLHGTKLGRRLIKAHFDKMATAGGEQSGIMDDEKTHVLLPDTSMLWYGTQLNVLNYDTDFYATIRKAGVEIIQGEIQYLDNESIILENGQSLKTDALICAIGYDISATVPLEPASRRPGWGCPVAPDQDELFSDLDTRADKELLTRYPLLRDSPVQPVRGSYPTPWRLWRLVAPPSQVAYSNSRNLVFLNAITCYQTTIKAELTSLWAYAYLHDKLAMPTPGEAAAIYEAALWTRFRKWQVPFGKQGIADFFVDAMPYYDLLLRDLGLRSWRKGWGWFGEVYGGAYRMEDYKDIVQEWMQAQEQRTTVEKKRL